MKKLSKRNVPKRVEFTDLIDIEPDTDFLEAYLKYLQRWYSTAEHLCKHDFLEPVELAYLPKKERDAHIAKQRKIKLVVERIAQIADEALVVIITAGKTEVVDGNLYRNVFDESVWDIGVEPTLDLARKQMKAIPKLITKTEKKRKPDANQNRVNDKKINQKLLEKLIEDHRNYELPAQHWADLFTCSRQAVCKTDAWKKIRKVRAMNKEVVSSKDDSSSKEVFAKNKHK